MRYGKEPLERNKILRLIFLFVCLGFFDHKAMHVGSEFPD